MLQIQQINKSYGIHAVLQDVSLVVNPGDRVGLIGPNGCGKTTLLRILVGHEAADSGSVTIRSGSVIGYLRQGLTFQPESSVAEVVLGPELVAARETLRQLAVDISEGDQLAWDAYAEAQAQFEALSGYDAEWRAEQILAELGLSRVLLATPYQQLSGGQQSRLGLAHLLMQQPDLLLLDEPTNHLDLEGLDWLEGFLQNYGGAALIASHDRVFLDRTVTRVLAFDEQTETFREFTGGYSAYTDEFQREMDAQWTAWNHQQAEIARIRGDIHRTKMHAMSVELTTTPRQPNVRRYAKKVAKKAKAREKKLERYLESVDRVDKPQQSWGLKLDFDDMPPGGQEVMTLRDVGHTFDGDRWLFRDVSLTLRHGERIALLGPNGAGKSTLIRIMLGELMPSEGHIRPGANIRFGYQPQTQESLNPADTALSTIRKASPMTETEARNLLHFFLFAGDDVFVPVEGLSYGQRARLLLARIVVQGANALILDEPLNHLDIPARERFEAALDQFPGAVLVTGHDRAFIDRYATGIWSLEGGVVRTHLNREEMMRSQPVR